MDNVPDKKWRYSLVEFTGGTSSRRDNFSLSSSNVNSTPLVKQRCNGNQTIPNVNNSDDGDGAGGGRAKEIAHFS